MPPKKNQKLSRKKVPIWIIFCHLYIVDGATLELLKNGKRIHVQHPRDSDITVVYILPKQPMACAKCGLLSMNFESFERHKCTPPTNSINKYVPEDIRKKAQTTALEFSGLRLR